jgi:peptidoglycan/LPS O-acetylase OafA/YrhL
VEEHFYLIWPALLVFSGKRRAQALAIVLALLVAVWRWWDFHHQWVAALLPGVMFAGRTDVRLDGLLLGCVVALWLDNPIWRARAQVFHLHTLAAVCGRLFAFHNHSPSAPLHSMGVDAVAHDGCGHCAPSRQLGGPIAGASHTALIGRLSYSLYLWQQFFVLGSAQRLFGPLRHFPLNVVMIFFCAFLSYELIERPFIRWGHRLAPPPTPGRTDVEVEQASSNKVEAREASSGRKPNEEQAN